MYISSYVPVKSTIKFLQSFPNILQVTLITDNLTENLIRIQVDSTSWYKMRF